MSQSGILPLFFVWISICFNKYLYSAPSFNSNSLAICSAVQYPYDGWYGIGGGLVHILMSDSKLSKHVNALET